MGTTIIDGQIKRIFRKKLLYRLSLADGSSIIISGADIEANKIVSRLAEIMQLEIVDNIPSYKNDCFKIIVRIISKDSSLLKKFNLTMPPKNNTYMQVLQSSDNNFNQYSNLVRLSLLFAFDAEKRGGILIHGALAEWNGKGIIIAAPGGTGKTTACNRLPKTWQSHCDDTALIVKGKKGNYFAHSWPTWSRFSDGGIGGKWNVKKAVSLKGIFILSRAAEDKIEPLGQGQAVSLLVQSVNQASSLLRSFVNKEKAELSVKRFNSICSLSNKIPVNLLHISLNGSFWEEIEKVL